MRRFSEQIVGLIANAYYWYLDYIYAGVWQILGQLRHADARGYRTPASSARNTPVIIIPGVYERWDFMQPVIQAIFRSGYAVHTIEGLGYNRGSVEDMARLVHEYAAEQQLQNCVLVAHSKGGLIGKYLLAQYADSPHFRGLITINTPFQGSRYAVLLPVRHLRIFIPGSPLLSLLAQNQRVNQNIVSIYNRFDPHIPGGSFLQGAKNIQLNTRGHFRILRSKVLHQEIIACLAAFQE